MAASKSLYYSYVYCDKEYQLNFTKKNKGYVDKFLCAICIQLLFDPVQTSCGHLFCDKCLKKWKKNTCPTCQTAFTRPALTDNFNNREVKNLTVLCPNLPRRCEWKGELGSVEVHQKDHCAYQLVQCPNKCGTAVERGEFEKHQKDHCELREYECPYCKNAPEDNSYREFSGYKGTFKDVFTTHFQRCGGYPVVCRNNCGAQGLVRGDLLSHLAACPEQVIPCTYQSLGCSDRLARKAMTKHNTDNRKIHLHYAMKTTNVLVNVIASQQQQITTLQQQMSVLLEKNGVQLPPAPQHPDKPWLKVTPLPLYPPFTIKMEEDVVVRHQFMSHPEGYRLVVSVEQLCLCVSPVDCPENHSLKWPVTITIKWAVLNQEEDDDHEERKLQLKLNLLKDSLQDRRLETYIDPKPVQFITILDVVVES